MVSAGNLAPVDTMLVVLGVYVLYQYGTKNGKILFYFFQNLSLFTTLKINCENATAFNLRTHQAYAGVCAQCSTRFLAK